MDSGAARPEIDQGTPIRPILPAAAALVRVAMAMWRATAGEDPATRDEAGPAEETTVIDRT